MDFFDRILPKPIRTEEFVFYSDRSPELLVRDIQGVFEKTRGFVFSPNLTGEFTSAYSFKARPKWSLLVINKGTTGPAVRMRGEVNPSGSGSTVEIELSVHWTLGLFVLLPPAIALVWFIMVPKDRLLPLSSEDSIAPVGLLLFLPSFELLSAWVAKRLFKRNFVRCFKLTKLDVG
ncbi:MAG: hypothetical protein ABI432_09210 [Flavobacteriales bacterium]